MPVYGGQPSITWHIIFPASSCRNENCDWLPKRTANGPRPNPPTAITCNGIPLEKPKSARRRVTSGSSSPKIGLATIESMCATAPLLSFDKGMVDIGGYFRCRLKNKRPGKTNPTRGRIRTYPAARSRKKDNFNYLLLYFAMIINLVKKNQLQELPKPCFQTASCGKSKKGMIRLKSRGSLLMGFPF